VLTNDLFVEPIMAPYQALPPVQLRILSVPSTPNLTAPVDARSVSYRQLLVLLLDCAKYGWCVVR